MTGGKVTWCDVDLTLEEPRLAQLAAATGQPIWLLTERAGRFTHEDAPLLDDAIFSVTPSGHTQFKHQHIQRRADGTLGIRPAPPRPRYRRPSRPRQWRFWDISTSQNQYDDAAGQRSGRFLYLGRGTPGTRARSGPLLVVGVHRWHGVNHGAWIQWTWCPSSGRYWAPTRRAKGWPRPRDPSAPGSTYASIPASTPNCASASASARRTRCGDKHRPNAQRRTPPSRTHTSTPLAVLDDPSRQRPFSRHFRRAGLDRPPRRRPERRRGPARPPARDRPQRLAATKQRRLRPLVMDPAARNAGLRVHHQLPPSPQPNPAMGLPARRSWYLPRALARPGRSAGRRQRR